MNIRSRSTTVPSSCDGCGACCGVVRLPPFMRRLDGTGEEAWDRLRWDRADLYEAFLKVERALQADEEASLPGPCAWYDAQTKRCRNHSWRPEACRRFEIGGVDCLDARRRGGVEG